MTAATPDLAPAGANTPVARFWDTPTLAVASCLLLLGLAKLAEPMATVLVLVDVWGLGDAVARSATAMLSVGEIGLAVLVMVPRTRRLGLMVAALGVALVTASPIAQLLTGSNLSCGCGGFGLDGFASQAIAVIRNVFLLVLCYVAVSRLA